MTSQTFFFVFIPILSIILLSVNLILAPHNPYEEKDSAFECGFHSFLGQNRSEFSISFFIFALLFLLFDLEILLVYPYVVSSYVNGIFGLIIMLVFFIILTLGFAFELGKNALTIESRQVSWKQGRTESTKLAPGLFGYDPPRPHAFAHVPKQSGLDYLIKFFVSVLQTKYNRYINSVVLFIAMLSMFYPIKIIVAILGTEFNNSQLFLIHVLICFHIGIVCRNLCINHRLPSWLEYGLGLLVCVAISIFIHYIIPNVNDTFLSVSASLLVFIQYFSINRVVSSLLQELCDYQFSTPMYSQGSASKSYLGPPKISNTLNMNNNGRGNSSGAGSSSNQGNPSSGASRPQPNFPPFDPELNPHGYHPQYNPLGVDMYHNPFGYHPQHNSLGFHPHHNPSGYDPQHNPYGYHPHHNPGAFHPSYNCLGSRSQLPANPQVSANSQTPIHPQPAVITRFNGLTEGEWLGLVGRVDNYVRSMPPRALADLRSVFDGVGASVAEIDAVRDYLSQVEDKHFKHPNTIRRFSLNGQRVKGNMIDRMRAAR